MLADALHRLRSARRGDEKSLADPPPGDSVRRSKDDHPPAHVHVVGDGLAKIDLAGPDGRPFVVWTKALNRAEERRAFALVSENRDALLERWRDIHGA